MIATQIPSEEKRSGKKSEVAAAYGISVAEFGRAMVDFLQGEGYDDHGQEAHSLHAWLTMSHDNPRPDKTPYQKGDDWEI